MNSYFSTHLMDWHRLENDRQMPWKGEKDPYRIWLSEVMLQQTRVEQGWAYYQRFLEAFPTLADLAAAPEAKVYKLWEGLGYYSRCRNLIATAKYITHELHGRFPESFEALLMLKGVGNYTAAAIASFAFGLPHAVVDGNVIRVLSRFFGHTAPVDAPGERKKYDALAQSLLDKKDPAGWNQAIMDFGATQCTPRNPDCTSCPLRLRCAALAQDRVAELPVKSKKAARKTRHFHYVVCEKNGRWLVRERLGKDIWQHLHDFLLIENTRTLSATALWKQVRAMDPEQPVQMPEDALQGPYRQLLTHQEIIGTFCRIRAGKKMKAPEGYRWVPRKRLHDLAFPRMIVSYLEEIS